MPDLKQSQLPVKATPLLPTDLISLLDESGAPANKMTTVQNLLNGVQISPFVKSNGGQFVLKGQPFKYFGFNYYPMYSLSQPAVASIMDAFKRLGCTVLRSWLFANFFRSLVYPLGPTNFITNPEFETDTSGWFLDSGWSRSNVSPFSGSWSLALNAAFNTYPQVSTSMVVTPNTNYVLTFQYKLAHTGGNQNQNEPRVVFGSTNGAEDIFNAGYTYDTGGVYVQKQIFINSGNRTLLWVKIQNFGGQNVGYYDHFDFSVQQTPTLVTSESALVNIDMIMDEAGKRDIKMMWSMADNNANFNTKSLYVGWANTLYNAGLSTAFPYIGFFQSTRCRDLFKQSLNILATRKNTINGKFYNQDPAWFSTELGNELRIDNFSDTVSRANVNLMDDWITDVGTYFHSIDTNHMLGFGDMGHTQAYYADGTFGVDEDLVSNGGGYGVDYATHLANPVINYGDAHLYPNQNNANGFGFGAGGGAVKGWGYRLGAHPVSHFHPSADGYRRQLHDYVDVAKSFGKPFMITETGMDVAFNPTGDYPITTRYLYLLNLAADFLDYGGAGINIWHSVNAKVSGGSYDMALNAWGGEAVTDNTDDTNTMNLIKAYNARYNANLLDSRVASDSRYSQTDYTQVLATSGTISINPSFGDLLTQTPAGDSTFNMASVGRAGKTLTFIITTSGTTSRNLTFGTNFKSTGVLATGTVTGKTFTVTFKSDGTNYIETGRTGAM